MAVKFNGTTQLYARTANLPAANAITICAWVRTTTAPTLGWKIPIAAGNTTGSLEFSVGQHSPAGVVAWSLFDGTAKTDFPNQPKALEACFLAFTNDGTTLRGYSRLARLPTLDAVSTTAPTGTVNAISAGTSVFDGTDFFDGLIWEYRVWNRVLTAAELLAESRSHTPVSRNLLNLTWRMRTAQDTLDRSGQGRLPTITGTPTTVFDQAEFLYRKPASRKLFAPASGLTTINQAVGAWAWSGATASTSQLINQSVGAWSWSGTTATTNNVISATPGAWTWAGTTAATTQLISHSVGVWTWAGTTATTSQLIAATVGTWSWAGTTATTNQALNTAPGSWVWSGTTATLGAGAVNATPGAWGWAGTTASTSQLINASVGAWSWSGSTATTNSAINAGVGAYSWAGTTATTNQVIASSVGAWSWSGTTADVQQLVTIGQSVGAWGWSGTTATIGLVDVSAAGGYGGRQKKKYIVKHGDQLLVFTDKQSAIQVLTQQALPAKKKPRALPKPEEIVSLHIAKEVADSRGKTDQFTTDLDSKRYEALVALFEQLRDEEEIELLLLHEH